MIAHWDEVEPREVRVGDIGGRWQRLGDAAGTVGVGANRILVEPGDRSTAVHTHGASEEVYYVLAGSGLHWEDGRTYAVAPGDCIVCLPYRGDHTLVAGADGLDVLVFGTRHPTEFGALPRAGVLRFGGDAADISTGPEPWQRELDAGPLELPEPSPRPANIVALAEAEVAWGGTVRQLAASAGSVRVGLNHAALPPGEQGAPPHCHSLEEEVFVILDGAGTLQLWERGAVAERELRRGHVVARPPGTGVAHAFRAGPAGLTYLAYGTREPNDMTYYPELRTVRLRGLGVSFTLPD